LFTENIKIAKVIQEATTRGDYTGEEGESDHRKTQPLAFPSAAQELCLHSTDSQDISWLRTANRTRHRVGPTTQEAETRATSAAGGLQGLAHISHT